MKIENGGLLLIPFENEAMWKKPRTENLFKDVQIVTLYVVSGIGLGFAHVSVLIIRCNKQFQRKNK